ncbi:cytochrome P450 [Nonomuraea sp. NPDC005650]|uniref:cytochrome P450 n=1 Tax=Nonomuraea sp. NPDC005650 TaxID=3157045 RepID=UPI0033B15B66
MDTMPFDRPLPLEPPPAYARLRATSPVARVLAPDGQEAWLITSYQAAATVLSDRRFGIAPPGADTTGNDTLFQDGEAHIRLRRAVSHAFGPRALDKLVPRVEGLAEECVRAMAEAGPPADLMADLAVPLSITVISELLGVPPQRRPLFRELSDAVSRADFLFGEQDQIAAAAQAWQDFGAHAATLVAAKRSEPGEDLLSRLVTEPLTDDELTAMITTIVTGGYLSASNAVGVTAMRVITEGRLPGLTPAVVDEALRMQSGRTGEPFPRYAHQDLELDGVAIKSGDLVLVRLEAAHRDPAHFTDPDRFLPGRRSAPPLVFGHGPHYCLGAVLARAEIGAALSALSRHLPGARLAEPLESVEWTTNSVDIGPLAVRVTW